jgi:hypothetical protein
MKIDFKLSVDSYKAKRGEFKVLEVLPMQYLMIDGHGDPNTSEQFKDSVESLYPIAYKLKFMSKKELDKDYVVPPLEGLWYADDMSTFSVARDKSKWSWTLLLMTPDWVTKEMFERVIRMLAETKPPKLLSKVRLEKYDEGLCVQTLHIGSFDNEAPILDELHNQFIPNNGYKMTKKHHEIYFSDFRKVAPEKLKTILRQPIS